MDVDGEELPGGNASGPVVRIGNTVRKPWSANTPIVHSYVESLLASGIDVPKPLGRDELGRQVIEFVPGDNAQDSLPFEPERLRRIGALVRRIHDASETFDISNLDPAETLFPVTGANLMCHGDLAPWNLISGDREVFIDWDGASPSTRLWDLAYAAQSFSSLIEGIEVERAATNLRAFVDGYDADADVRHSLPGAMSERSRAMHDLLKTSNAAGVQPWATMYVEGHGAFWWNASEYIARNREAWLDALTH